MKDVRVDVDGNLRCWKCGSKNFLNKRTGRAHIIGYTTLGLGALLTKKKLKCQQCNTYNQVGNAKPLPYNRGPKASALPPPPAGAMAATSPPPPSPGGVDKIEKLRQLAELRDQGILTDEEFAAEKANVLAGG